jgi:hypothetical protein
MIIEDYISIANDEIIYPKNSPVIESSNLNKILPISIVIESNQNKILSKSLLSCNEELNSNNTVHILSAECVSYEANKTSLSWAKSFTNSINFLKNRGISKSFPTVKTTNEFKTVSESSIYNSANSDCKVENSYTQVKSADGNKINSATNVAKPNTKSVIIIFFNSYCYKI